MEAGCVPERGVALLPGTADGNASWGADSSGRWQPVFCPSFGITREIWVHSTTVLKQRQVVLLLSADSGSQTSSGLPLAYPDLG